MRQIGTLRRCVLAAALGIPSSLSAQMNVGAVALGARHELLPVPMLGVAISSTSHPVSQRTGMRVGIEYLEGRQHRLGTPCGGFLMSSECPPERVRDVASATLAHLAFDRRLGESATSTVAWTTQLFGGMVDARSIGETTRRAVYRRQLFFGGETGARFTWQTVHASPVALDTRLTGGLLVPGMLPYGCVDCDRPFATIIPTARVVIGASWIPRP